MPDHREPMPERPELPHQGGTAITGAAEQRPLPVAWPDGTPVDDALHLIRASQAVFCESTFTEPWGVRIPALPHSLAFHLVCSGHAWIDDGHGHCRPLPEGALVLLPHGTGHALVSAPGVAAVALEETPRMAVSPHHERLHLGGGGTIARVLCGAVRVDEPAGRDLVKRLPALLVSRDGLDSPGGWLQGVLAMLEAAARLQGPSAAGLYARLADVVLLHGVRSWLERATDTGWLGAIRDPQVGRALAAVHRNPAAPWTIASLARQAGMSRSAFAARFTALMGEPVMQYVLRWRMYRAADALQREDTSLGAIAERVGYESEAAFGRAFKRVLGVSPGAARRQPAPARHGAG